MFVMVRYFSDRLLECRPPIQAGAITEQPLELPQGILAEIAITMPLYGGPAPCQVGGPP